MRPLLTRVFPYPELTALAEHVGCGGPKVERLPSDVVTSLSISNGGCPC